MSKCYKKPQKCGFLLSKRHNSDAAPLLLRICSAPINFVMFVPMKIIVPDGARLQQALIIFSKFYLYE